MLAHAGAAGLRAEEQSMTAGQRPIQRSRTMVVGPRHLAEVQSVSGEAGPAVIPVRELNIRRRPGQSQETADPARDESSCREQEQ